MNNWKTIGSKKVYQNPFFTITEFDVERSNGRQSPYFVMDKPNMSIIIPLTEQNETYLIGQYRYAAQIYSWEFPMGALLKSENDPQNVARIELKEETGLSAADWKKIGEFRVANGFCSQKAFVYIAQNLEMGDSQPEPGEILELKKVPITAVGSMIASGEIGDGPTICAYHFLETYLDKTK